MGNSKRVRKEAELKNEQVILKFKKKKRVQTVIMIVIFAVAFFAVWYSNNRDRFPDDTVRQIIVFSIWIVVLGGLILSYATWRCPACGVYLGRMINPGACRKCGAKLR